METSTETPTGPFHVLMATATAATMTTSPSKERILLFDPRLLHDYVAKRKKAYGTETNGNKHDIWDGVSKVERDLVCCCEKPEENEDDRDAYGALDIEKEIRFSGILARDCHTIPTRCLALAILERTLDTSLLEMEEEDDSEKEDGENEEEEMEGVASDDERDDDWKPGQKRRRSPRHMKDQQKRKRQRTNKEEKEDKREDEEVGRLEQFLAAGGLKILNRWLIEAADEEEQPPLKSPPGSIRKPQPTGPKPPAGRPLILPILRFLERIPFDKKLVMDSKINKQIRKLGKQVDGILEARARGKHRREDLENWTTEPTSAETDALDHVQDAVDTVKSSWEQMAKKQNDKFTDPFESLKEKMRERLDILTQFETGAIPKPDWLETQEPDKDAKKKAATPKRPNTQELAAKERKAEREDLKNALRAAADEHRERMAVLRETLRKRKEESAPSIRHKKAGGKKVVWKDDMRTQTNRNRKLLEEVFLFEKKLPASRRGLDENVDDFEAEESTSSSSDEAARGDASTLSDDAIDHSLL
jgi:hypothetical protein